MVAPFCTIGKNTLLAELLTITIFFSGGWLGTTAPALPAKPRAKTKRTDINARDVLVTDLRRLSSIPVETVKVVWRPRSRSLRPPRQNRANQASPHAPAKTRLCRPDNPTGGVTGDLFLSRGVRTSAGHDTRDAFCPRRPRERSMGHKGNVG